MQTAIGEETPNLRERLSTLPNIELKDIREHYRRTHTAGNMRFIITGRIKRRKRKILRMLENWDLKDGERLAVPEDNLHPSDAVLIRRKDASNITFGFSYVIPKRLSAKKVHTMDCLNHIVTGTMNSRIFGKARKRGLVYGMGSCVSNSVHNCSWDFDGEVSLEDAENLFDLIHKELTNIVDGNITDEEIAAAKAYTLGRYQIDAQTVGQISDYYTDSYFVNDEISDYDRTPEIINSITKTDIIKIAQKFISSGISALVVVSSCEKSLVSDLSEKLKI